MVTCKPFLYHPTNGKTCIDFVTYLLVSTKWKDEPYYLILVLDNQLTKMVHYEPVMITINLPGPAEVIIKAIIRHYGISDSIVSD